jgi:hypothetical protein
LPAEGRPPTWVPSLPNPSKTPRTDPVEIFEQPSRKTAAARHIAPAAINREGPFITKYDVEFLYSVRKVASREPLGHSVGVLGQMPTRARRTGANSSSGSRKVCSHRSVCPETANRKLRSCPTLRGAYVGMERKTRNRLRHRSGILEVREDHRSREGFRSLPFRVRGYAHSLKRRRAAHRLGGLVAWAVPPR